MRRQMSGFLAGLVLGIVLASHAAIGGAQSGDPKPANASIVLENARVRVRDVTFPPGAATMHTHDLAHVGIVIQPGTLIFKYPDGRSETAKLEAGGVGFRDANVTHQPVNPGSTPVRVIEVELK